VKLSLLGKWDCSVIKMYSENITAPWDKIGPERMLEIIRTAHRNEGLNRNLGCFARLHTEIPSFVWHMIKADQIAGYVRIHGQYLLIEKT